MTYRIEIILFGLPKTTNGAHGSWQSAAAERKKWRRLVANAVLARGKPKTPLKVATLVCTRFSSSQPDYDNLAVSFKSCVDGLRDAGVILDDKDAVLVKREYLWVKAAPKQGRISIVVEEITQ